MHPLLARVILILHTNKTQIYKCLVIYMQVHNTDRAKAASNTETESKAIFKLMFSQLVWCSKVTKSKRPAPGNFLRPIQWHRFPLSLETLTHSFSLQKLRACPGNNGYVVGVHPEWEASPPQCTMQTRATLCHICVRWDKMQATQVTWGLLAWP